eukprot:18231-Heterococcus_DN1.PRE.1
MDSINYRPKTRESRAAYEELMAFVQLQLGAQPHDILCGAAEEVLSLLKDDTLQDPDRHKEIQKLLGKIKPEKFNTVVNIGKRITDFSTGGADDSATAGGANADDQDDTVNDKLDEDMGVAVVFDSDDDDANGDNADNDLDEVRDSEDELDDDDDGTTAGGGNATSAARQERQLRGQDDDTIEEEDQ